MSLTLNTAYAQDNVSQPDTILTEQGQTERPSSTTEPTDTQSSEAQSGDSNSAETQSVETQSAKFPNRRSDSGRQGSFTDDVSGEPLDPKEVNRAEWMKSNIYETAIYI